MNAYVKETLCITIGSGIDIPTYLKLLKYIRPHQYSETNVMHFLVNLLRIKCLYMFRALLDHPQEVLHKRHLVYYVRVMSVGFTRMVQL
jgi:hypothetical protein